MSLTRVSGAMIGGPPPQNAFTPNVVVYENSSTLRTNYVVTTGSNAISAGPISIADGVVVTIPDGSVWTIV